jgi:2-dehydro-3-deoxyphosphooctonate aldolase (KDO 8-P synthase)
MELVAQLVDMMCHLRFHAAMPRCSIGTLQVGEDSPLLLVSGPCVLESEELALRTAEQLAGLARRHHFTFLFKSSYEKDNRERPDSYRGPGLERGLAALRRVRRELGIPVTTDVHRAEDVDAVAAEVELLQIPALLCRQTSLLEAAGRSGVPVNIKKGQFMSPAMMAGAVAKVREAGGSAVLLTERGTSFGYDRLICDFTSLPALQALGCPVLFDAGHAAPSRAQIGLLARCGVAAGADGLFLECHPEPARALCDGERMLSLPELSEVLAVVARLADGLREGKAG